MLLTSDVGAGVELADPVARDRLVDRGATVEPELADQALELGAVRALLVAAGGAVDVEPRRPVRCADGAQDRLEPLRRRGAAEDERAQLVAGALAARHGSPAKSIPCPSGTSFGVSSGNERRSTLSTFVDAAVAARRSGLARQCAYQSRTGTPSGRASGAASTA